MRIKDERQTFLGIWIRCLVENKPFEVWGGEQLRDFTYVEDAVEALLAAIENEAANGMIFNLGGMEVVSLNDLAQLLIDINGSGEYLNKSFPESRKQIDIGNYYSDFSLIREAIGWAPQESIQSGLKKTISFYRKNHNNFV